jgi:hypothetical protein
MIKKKHTLILILVLVLTTSLLWPLSLENLSVQGGYVMASPEDSLINSANGPGYDVSLKWRISNRWSFLIKSEHWYLSIDQENAHRVLEWPYWRQIYGNVIFQAENDPIYDVTVEPRQDLKIKPVEAGLMWNHSKTASFQVGASLTGGISWFHRQLYIEEFWKKHFPSIDYTFTYDFQNRSDAETGWLWSLTPGVSVRFQPLDKVSISLEGTHKTYFKSPGEAEFFPLKNHFSFSLGVHFLY